MTYDIAVLMIEDNEILRQSGAMAVEVASSAEVQVLDTAIAIGNAEGRGISATRGCVNVISELIEMSSLDGSDTMVETRVMRVDTAVNHGNSGGGLFNANGQLIGIVNAKEASVDIDNMGYAIPSDLAVAVADNVIRNCDGESNLNPIKPTIGVAVSLSNLSVSYDNESGTVKKESDILIVEVVHGGVAEGNLLVDDIIASIVIDGKTYTPIDYTQIAEILLYAIPDAEVIFNVERAGSATGVSFVIPQSAFAAVK